MKLSISLVSFGTRYFISVWEQPTIRQPTVYFKESFPINIKLPKSKMLF